MARWEAEQAREAVQQDVRKRQRRAYRFSGIFVRGKEGNENLRHFVVL